MDTGGATTAGCMAAATVAAIEDAAGRGELSGILPGIGLLRGEFESGPAAAMRAGPWTREGIGPLKMLLKAAVAVRA